MRLILLGAPGSGKGTIATALHQQYGVTHISTGDIFRANIKASTPLGIQAKSFIEKGELVPDSVTISMLEDRLAEPDCKKAFMLDGFPRTIAQAEELDRFLTKSNSKIDAVLSMRVSDDVIVKRISERRICVSCGAGFSLTFRPSLVEGICDECGGQVIQREDDKPETVMNRLKTYYEKTQPLVDYYEKRGLVLSVDNEGGLDPAMEEIRAGLTGRGIL